MKKSTRDKILIIDGEEEVRLLCQTELTADGYDVATAEDFPAALQKLETEAIDLVVLNAAGSSESVLADLQSLVEFRPGVALVVNSEDHAYLLDFRSWAADAVLSNSSDLKELKRTINQLLPCHTN